MTLKLALLFAAPLASLACGGYQRQWVERAPLVAAPPDVRSIELVDVRLAGISQTPNERLVLRQKTLPLLKSNAEKILGRTATLPSTLAGPAAPVADAWRPCSASSLGGDAGWKMAIAISEHTQHDNSILAVFLATKSYRVTVAIAVWDAENRLVNHERITFTKDADGNTATHSNAPPDDELFEDSTSIESAGSAGDPLWLKAVAAALPEYLARFRTSRVQRFVRDGSVYSEPPDRAAYRAKYAEPRLGERCDP